jgi:hypothetical protein
VTPSISISRTPSISVTPSISISSTPSVSVTPSTTPPVTPSTTPPVSPSPSPTIVYMGIANESNLGLVIDGCYVGSNAVTANFPFDFQESDFVEAPVSPGTYTVTVYLTGSPTGEQNLNVQGSTGNECQFIDSAGTYYFYNVGFSPSNVVYISLNEGACA